MSLISRSDLLRALSLDSQAQLSSDLNRPIRIATADGVLSTWDTPFLEATALRGYVNGALVAGTTLGMATGTDGVDRITFPSPPALGAIIAVAADGGAINWAVVSEAVSQAEQLLRSAVQSAGYAWPISGAALEAETPVIVALTKWLLRDRRSTADEERSGMPTWLRDHLADLAKGSIKLPPGTALAGVDTTTVSYGSEEQVFAEESGESA